MNKELERDALLHFFETICAVKELDNSISDFKIIKNTQNKLRTALRNSPCRCTCAKMTWGGICEVCQGSDSEMVSLRNFFQVIRNAKKYNMTTKEMQDFITNTKQNIVSASV